MDFKQIQIAPFNSSLKEQRYLLTCGDNFYEAGEHLAHLVEILQNAPDEESGIQKYVSQSGGKYTTEQIRNVVKNTVYHLFETKEKKRVFIYEKQLLSAEKIDLFSQRLSFLFSKAVMSAVFAIGLMLDIYYFVSEKDLLVFNNADGPYTVTFLLAFTVFSSFFHELGHAAACKHFGIKHGAIGLGLYLNFPVLYTDVTRVWTLQRQQRCVVNIAGVYFQFLLLIPILGVLLLTGNDICRYIVLIMNLGFVITLNPFFKFDGYWLMTDTIVKATAGDKPVSVCLPTVSPDGKYLIYTESDYGTFPIWHREAELRMIDLQTMTTDSLKSVNSINSDTYHTFSSNSRWVVFASKRDDGLYGKPYFFHIDSNGNTTKPFVLPQKYPDFYDNCLKSFNIPELSNGAVPFSVKDVENVLKREGEGFN